MVETSLDIRFSADGEACVILDSTAEGEAEQQAELVCFAHYAATTIGLLGSDRAAELIELLSGLDEARMRVADPDRSFPSDKAIRVRARFLNARRGPRISFAVKSRGIPAPDRGGGELIRSSVAVLFNSLLKRRAADPHYVRRLESTAGHIARLAGEGRIADDNQFDVSLAAADVAWRSDVAEGIDGVEVECPACANRESSAFELRLWPSDRAAISKCRRCGTGVWIRARRRPRTLPTEVWRAMEAMRDELSRHTAQHDMASDVPESALLGALKRVFVENDWPFSDVRGAQVIVSELSGPLGSWKFYAQAVDDRDLVLLFSVCPLRVPEERRAEVAQFLTRANYGLAAGNFELDFDDGEIRYKTALQLQGQDVDGATLRQLVRANGIAMETYLPGIGAVITGSKALPALERRSS